METPYLLVDPAKTRRNILKMAGIARANGVSLRPHVKTHKIPALAREQVEAGGAGITVAKLSEAEVMADGGLDDIFIAFPIVTDSKIWRAASLSQRVRLILAVDSLEGARRLDEVAGARGVILEVRLEIDTGYGRTGVPERDAVGLAREIGDLDNLRMTGIYTYRGAVMRDGSPALDLEAAGTEEGRLMVSVAGRLRAAGAAVRDVSVGSTPTAEHAARVAGITEVRPGTYVFYDRMQTRLGACSPDECAARIVATVVSRPAPGLAIIDGGSKTFATDVQPNSRSLDMEGFGHVVGHPKAVLGRLTEEHGMLTVGEDDGPRVGDTLEIIPNHICSTVNLHDMVYMQNAEGENGDADEVRVAARGKVT